MTSTRLLPRSAGEVVAHCVGIHREIGDQTYQRVNIKGTAMVIEAAKRAEAAGLDTALKRLLDHRAHPT